MKTIYKTIAIFALILNAKTSFSQEPNTKESTGKQYINNRVPGLKYGPSAIQKSSIQSDNSKQNTTGNIRDIIFTGGVPANKPQASRTNQTLAKPSNVKLTSEEKATEPEKNKPEIKNIIPSQGDVKPDIKPNENKKTK
ncbi:hypothetical protein [Pedobacter sp. B4-66]|uniref:hypothetical protein n=1 Tax=Pedobacter sp. B4-66 TaxID=2817280 RepID=UPI001BDAF9CD|nr:hypothetical protein [Pedobacter sp. B4-66]